MKTIGALLALFVIISSVNYAQSFQVFGGGAASTLEGEDGAFYLDRSNHSGFQGASTISDYGNFDNISASGSIQGETLDITIVIV